MSGFTNYVSRAILGHITGKTPIFSMPSCYVGLFTAAGLDDGTGFTECSGGSYARAATAAGDWASPGGTSPSSIANANAISFPLSTGAWGTVVAFGLFDALTAGNLMVWDYFGVFDWLPATVSAASPAVITVPGHGFSNGDLVEWTIEHGGVNPTFSASNFTGQLTVANATTNTFTVTNGGVAVNTSAPGNGSIRKILPQVTVSGGLLTVPAGALTLSSS
jgi:hypothetical protein